MKQRIVVGIHPDRIGDESYSSKWTEFLSARSAEVRILDLLAPKALEHASHCDGVMWRWTHNPRHKQSAQMILYIIEHYLGIPVFPDNRTSWHYDEKTAQFYLLSSLQAPMPKTWLFWDRRPALAWAGTVTYPVVFKLSVGAGSSNVLKIETQEQAISLIKRAFQRGIFPYTMNEYRPQSFYRSWGRAKVIPRRLRDAVNYVIRGEYPTLHNTWWKPEHSYVYFQEFLSGNAFDTRITVIGDRAFGYRRMNRLNDFRASGSGDFVTDPKLIDKRCVEIAFKISKLGKFQSMAYDFLYKNGSPVVCEISYTFVDWMVQACPGHWGPELNWYAGQMWPEEAHVEDFVAYIKNIKLEK
jgi:glutathione synthase/RimK-type ligase-like ATP-grasp enzyme